MCSLDPKLLDIPAVWKPLSDYSAFARRTLRLWPVACQRLLDQNRLQHASIDQPDIAFNLSLSEFDQKLREIRQTECLRIAWRDVTKAANLTETLTDLSVLAEYLLQTTLNYHQQRLKQQFGQPLQHNCEPALFCVLAMGKLGGGELNFSSDIDVVFVHNGSGQTASVNGSRSIDNTDFFTRLAQAIIRSLDAISEFGQVYRVDTRLRPYGSTGRLVWSTGAMEQYYLQEGRDWERYALLKARPVAGDIALGVELLRELQPFIYRRYLDYGLFAGVRQMSNDIATAAARKRHREHLKLGPGGIREIEFLVHSLQLLRGGQRPALRESNLLKALALLNQYDLIRPETARLLEQAYHLLRHLENGLQILDDQQTHVIPDNPEYCDHWSQLTGFNDFSELQIALQQARDYVTDHFETWFGDVDDGAATRPLNLNQPLTINQLDGWPDDIATEQLPVINTSLARINKQPLSSGARSRLESLLPELLQSALKTHSVEHALLHGLALLESIAGRSNYLALLQEQPQALARMLDYGARSSYIANKLQRQPALLDELIDPVTLADLPTSLDDYQQRIQLAVAQHDEDPEQQLYRLQHWRHSYALRIAANELLEKIDTQSAQQQLNWLAETTIGTALIQAQALIKQDVSLTVIAYGTLGANEMHYESDLDLVFLYSDETGGAEQRATRKAQKLIHLLTSMGPGGRLYEIDTRLRPNGKSGTLVSSLRAFSEYQKNQAWVWEQQALCRARCIYGDQANQTGFQQLRQSLLVPAQADNELRDAILGMYQRVTKQQKLTPVEQWRLKAQFITQYWLLTTYLPDAAVPENLLEQLSYLAKAKPDIRGVCQQLANDAIKLQHYRHQQQLKNDLDEPGFDQLQINTLWANLFVSDGKSPAGH